jgi:hypothetical protein
MRLGWLLLLPLLITPVRAEQGLPVWLFDQCQKTRNMLNPLMLDMVYSACCDREMQKCDPTQNIPVQLACFDAQGQGCMAYMHQYWEPKYRAELEQCESATGQHP